MASQVNSLWTQDLPESEREAFKEYLLSQSKHKALKRLRDIVQNRRQVLEGEERNPSCYSDQCWAYRQAHQNGARQVLKILEDLLIFVD